MRRCPAGGGDRLARFNSNAVYRDDVESYSTVEPAIDLTATSPLAFALVAARRWRTPTSPRVHVFLPGGESRGRVTAVLR
jgi:hypothetical protein